jgi:hypothetical protein
VAYKIFKIGTPSDIDLVVAELDDCFEPQVVAAQLKKGLDPRCKKIIVEENYNDKDYRSTYYNYYAKKGYAYQAGCARLHFFDDRVELRDGLDLVFTINELEEQPSNTYFGYMVLRPTRINTIGRTVIAPSAIDKFHGCIIESDHKVHLLGHKLTVSGFPYMSQHTDISVCAHAACWGILRHCSERFSKYAEFLTYDITRMAHEFDPGGLLPSTGLHVGHAERVFATGGTYPVLVVKDSADPGIFYRQLFAYVESGFPLFTELERIVHAITIIGHTGFATQVSKNAPCHFASDLVGGLVAVDDNYLPYRTIAPGVTDPYGSCDITAFIVPLPDKIYYPAEAADNVALLLANEQHLGFDHSPIDEPVVRYFLTTTSHLRSFMRRNRSQFDSALVGIVMQLQLPQFVWILEIASKEQWRNGTISTRVVVDATASPAEEFPIFLMHNAERAYFADRGGDRREQYVKLLSPNAPLSRMEGNLVTH